MGLGSRRRALSRGDAILDRCDPVEQTPGPFQGGSCLLSGGVAFLGTPEPVWGSGHRGLDELALGVTDREIERRLNSVTQQPVQGEAHPFSGMRADRERTTVSHAQLVGERPRRQRRVGMDDLVGGPHFGPSRLSGHRTLISAGQRAITLAAHPFQRRDDATRERGTFLDRVGVGEPVKIGDRRARRDRPGRHRGRRLHGPEYPGLRNPESRGEPRVR